VSSAEFFVTKLIPSALVRLLHYLGRFYDEGRAIAVDTAGNAYVTGYTMSSKLPTMREPSSPLLSAIRRLRDETQFHRLCSRLLHYSAAMAENTARDRWTPPHAT